MPLLRFILRLLSLIIAVLLVLPLVILLIYVSQKTNNRKLNKKILNNWSKILCRIFGLKLKYKGKIQSNPVFIVANHVTWLDIPVIHSIKLAGFVAKEEISKWPVLGWAVKSGETLFISRGNKESRQKVLENINARLEKRHSIAVFPEGKVTDGSYLGRFHRQLMHAAVQTKTPIQAIAIKYYKKDGSRNKQIGFIGEESFVKNVIRILRLPTSEVELTFCETIETKNITAREAALISFEQVNRVLIKDDYL